MPKRLPSLLRDNYSLREIKYAQTKNAILDIFTEKLKKQYIEEVSIREICNEAQISEGTFYNYFPKKTDILVMHIALWSIKSTWLANKKLKETGSGLKAINEIFAFTAHEMQERGVVLYEVISFLSRMRKIMEVKDISFAEKVVVFPDLPGIEKIKAKNISDMMRVYIDKAIVNKELPKNINIDHLQLNIRTIFFGAPLALTLEYVDKIDAVYQNELGILWRSLQSGTKQKNIDKQIN